MLPKYNLVGLGFLSVMERNVFSSKPIKTGSDLQGMKIRVMQSPGYVKAYESFGAQPTPMAYGDVYMALQQGVVDGADTSPRPVRHGQVHRGFEVLQHHAGALPAGAADCQQDGLGQAARPEQRKIVQDSAAEGLAESRAYYKKSYDESIANMKKAGVQVIEPNVAD